MFGPAWMASPPEVHSSLLVSGPGAGSLLAAAEAWRLLSAEYASAADEVGQLVQAVLAGSWQGGSGDSYAAAHAPFLEWLTQAGADSAVTASQLGTAAIAYDVALAAMPTLAELGANHATHAALIATNFFGVNTIPIAVNEADYARMWIQAATTMTGYQAVSTAALAATPQTASAPVILTSNAAEQVPAAYEQPPGFNNPLQGLLDQLAPLLKALGIEDGVTAHDPMISNELTTFVSQVLQNFGVNWDPGAGLLNGQVYDAYADASQPMWYVARSLELFQDFLNISQDPTAVIPALQYLAALAIFDWPTHIAQLASTISQSPALFVAAAGAVLAPAGAAGGLAGLAGLAVPLDPGSITPIAAPAAPGVWPASAPATPFGTAGTAPSSAPAPAPTATTAPGPAPSTPPAPATGTEFVAPYAVGPPGIGFGSGLGLGAGATDTQRAPEPEAAADAAATSAAVRRQKRARRQHRSELRAHEYMDATIDQSTTEASEQASGPLGCAGTAVQPSATPARLSRRSDGEFNTDPTVPMLPNSWGARPQS